MPYVSERQRRYFHANKAKLQAQGVDVGEWDRATKGKKLPERIKQAAFLDELEKIALKSMEVPKGTPIAHSKEEFLSQLEPGDIIATKPSNPSWLSHSPYIQLAQRFRGAKKDAQSWTHVGLYVGDGKIRHTYLPFKGKELNALGGEMTLRDQLVSKLKGLGREFLVLRPNVDNEKKQEAVERSSKIKGLPFSKLDLLRAGFWPRITDLEGVPTKLNKKVIQSAICTAVPAMAYPSIDFAPGKHHKTLMPSDIVGSNRVSSVVAYSET
jgi:hypothetical protein